MTPFELAMRFVGVKEIPGTTSNPLVLTMLTLDQKWPVDDEVPWCSAFANLITWLLRLPRSKNLAARSWLQVGKPIKIEEATPGYDVVILERGAGGHVGFFAGLDNDKVQLLGGNQGNAVNVSEFDKSKILGVRRLN